MSASARSVPEGWVSLVAGLVWLWLGSAGGFFGFLLFAVPGTLLLGSGLTLIVAPGDARMVQISAFGGLAGAVIALPGAVVAGWLAVPFLIALSLAATLAAGWYSIRTASPEAEVPEPIASVPLAAQVALDEAVLATMLLPGAAITSDLERVAREQQTALDVFGDRGWIARPESYHRLPPELSSPETRPRRFRGVEFEHLQFESGYEPDSDEPGRDRWLSYVPNRRAHAWLVRPSRERRRAGGSGADEGSWLIAINGYQTGMPFMDLSAFDPRYFCERLGINLLIPVLPLHGPRRIRARSGMGFLTGDILDTIHAEAQTIWDVRRLKGWLRSQGAERIGVTGLSLGGYNAALLASLDDDLACAIPGIPASDLAELFYLHATTAQLAEAEAAGVSEEATRSLMRSVSPLAIPPRVPAAHRALFGGTADRLVPPRLVRALWRHWDRPAITWYPGGHVTFRAHPSVTRQIEITLRAAGLAR